MTEATVELEKLGFKDVDIIDGEHVQTMLNLRRESKDQYDSDSNVVILTDKRLIHLKATGRNRHAVFVSLNDVFAIEVTSEHPGGWGGYLWGGLAFLLALVVWQVWNRPVLDVAAAIVLVAVGVYLIIDHITSPLILNTVVRTGSSQLPLQADSSVSPQAVYQFVNHVFLTKNSVVPEAAAQTAPPFTLAPH